MKAGDKYKVTFRGTYVIDEEDVQDFETISEFRKHYKEYPEDLFYSVNIEPKMAVAVSPVAIRRKATRKK